MIRVACYGLRVTGYALRGPGYGVCNCEILIDLVVTPQRATRNAQRAGK